MNKRILTMLLAVALPLLMLAQGWPAGYGGVMLQGFFWDSYKETPDCSPWGPWANHQSNSATQSHRPGYTWATMYGAGWDAATEEWQVPVTTWPSHFGPYCFVISALLGNRSMAVSITD